MANYAVIDNINVINIIIADSKEIAEEITGKICVLYNETDKAEIGGTYENNIFIPKKPYPSWILKNNIWVAPIEYPNDDKFYIWDEDTLSWKVNII